MRTHLLSGAAGVLCLAWIAVTAQPQLDSVQPTGNASIVDMTASALAEAQRLAQAASQVASGTSAIVPESAPLPVVEVVSAPPEPPAEPSPTPEPKSPLNFNDSEIGVILKYISDKTGKPIVKTEGVDKKITLINPRQQTDSENLKLLYQVLMTQGIAIVDTGELLVAMPATEAKKANAQVVSTTGTVPAVGPTITLSRQMKYARSADLVNRLKPLVRDPDALLSDDQTNTLFYTDVPVSVERVSLLIDMIDREPVDVLTTLVKPLKNASATEMLQPAMDFLDKYIQIAQIKGPKMNIYADRSTNSLILRGPTSQVNALSETIDRMDRTLWLTQARTTQTWKINHRNPEELIADAKEYLSQFVAVSGEPGAVPLSLFTYEPILHELKIKGPKTELAALFKVLPEMDKPVTTRPRKMNTKEVEAAIQKGLEIMLQTYASEGKANYRHSITWRQDPIDPSTWSFTGPDVELTRLFNVLDQVDKPLTPNSRRFYGVSPEEAIPKGLELMVKQFAEEGRPGYVPSITWERDPFNPSIIRLKGPSEEIARLLPLLDQIDKPLTVRSRQIYNATAETVISHAIDLMLKDLAKEGQPDYQHSITWERDPVTPSMIIFRGPAVELDRLIALLERVDLPLTTQRIPIANATPEEVIPTALQRLRQHYVDINRAEYSPITQIRVEPDSETLFLRGPQEELTILSGIISELDRVRWQKRDLITQRFDIGFADPEDLIAAGKKAIERQVKLTGKRGDEPGVTFEVDKTTNTILMYGPATQIALAREVMTVIEEDTRRDQKPVLIYPKFTSPTQLASELSTPLSDIFKGALAPRIRVLDRIGALLVTARPRDIPRVQEWIDILDTPSSGSRIVKVIKVDYITPTVLVNPLRNLVSTNGLVIPDDKAGRVVIVDTTAAVEHMQKVVKDLDQVAFADTKPKLYNLKYSNAAQLSSQISQTISAVSSRQSPPVIIPDTRLNSLIVAANPADASKVAELIATLDIPQGESLSKQIVKLENAEATSLASILQSLISPQGKIIPDYRTNTLLIIDSTETIQRTMPYIQQLDSAESSDDLVLEILKLKSANVYYMRDTLMQFATQSAQRKGKGRMKTQITLEPSSYSLIILGNRQDVKELLDIAGKLDDLALGEIKPRFVYLQNANAMQIYSQLSQLMSVITSPQNPARVIPESRTNALIVAAAPTDASKVLELIHTLDVPEDRNLAKKIIKLKNAQASYIYSSVQALLSPSGKVIPDYHSNSLLIVDSTPSVNRLMPFINELDVKQSSDMMLRVVPLKSANAAVLYNTVYYLKTPRGMVTYENTTNSVIIRDTTDSVEYLTQILNELDSGEGQRKLETEIRTLKYIESTYILNTLTQLASQLSERKGRGGRLDTRVYPEPVSNSLIIVGVSDEIKQMTSLIDRLDVEGYAGGEIKTYFLKHIKASVLESQIRSFYSAMRRYHGGGATAIMSNDNTNSLIAVGPAPELKRIEDLLAKIDVPNVSGLEMRLIPLEGVNAAELETKLRSLLSPRGILFSDLNSNSLILYEGPEVVEQIENIVSELVKRGGQIELMVRKLEYAQASGLYAPVTQFLQMQARMKGLTTPRSGAYAEPSTNSLVIFGPTDEIRIIQNLVDQMDTEQLAARSPKIVQLKYIQASQVASQLDRLVSQTPTTGFRSVIFAEPTTNSLVILASETDTKRIDEVIQQLDIPEAGGLVTHVFKLNRSSATDLEGILRPPLLSTRGRAYDERVSNSLIVIDTPEMIEKVKEFIAQVDVQGGELVTKVRRLENTTISALTIPLENFLQHQAQLKGQARSQTRVMPDPVSNSVVIYGPTEEVKLVEGLLDQLDAEQLFERQPRIFYLQNVQAQKIATTLEQLLAMDRRGPTAPRVLPDIQSNALIVMAPEADLVRAEELLKTLDVPETVGVETKVFPLKSAYAQTLVVSLRSLVGNPTRLFADELTNSIIYTDTAANLQRLEEIIRELDVIKPEMETQTVVRNLRNTNASSVYSAINDFVQFLAGKKGRYGRPLTRVSADYQSNSVVISGPTDEVSQVVGIVDSLDADQLRERQPKVFPLNRAQATAISLQLTQLISQFSTGPNAARIVPNGDTNSILVLATPNDMSLIEGVIQSLDTEMANQRQTRLFQLKNANVTETVAALRTALSPNAFIDDHRDSNSIVVTDTEANLQKVAALVAEMDAKSSPEKVVSKTIVLKNTKAGAIEVPLQTIIRQVTSLQQKGNKPPAQAFADPVANALVLVGASDEVSQLEHIVLELDSEALSERQPEVFFLEYSRAEDLAQEIQQLFLQTARYGAPSRVVADAWANALLVVADPRDMEWIRSLIKQLDTREGRKRVIEIFILENADASVLAERLQGLFRSGFDRRTRSGSGDFVRRTDTLTEGEVSIIADLRLNALIVTAEPQDMSQVADLIESLDIEAPNLEGPVVYPIENGEAETLAQTLQNLFNDTDFVGGYYFPVERRTSISGLSGKVRVIAEPTTNSLIVMASSPRAFEVIEQMIEELDKPSVKAGQTNIIPVRNALAQDLAKLLNEMFKPEQQQDRGSGRRFFLDDFFGGGTGGSGGSGGSYGNLVGKVRISSDSRTNSLLVITPELYRKSVEDLVRALDSPTSQVLMEVLIVEVAVGNGLDRGVQWGIDPVTGEPGKITVNNREMLTYDNDRTDFLNPDTLDYLTDAPFADSLQFFSLNQVQFQAVVNFLQSCRNLNIRTRPNILTADNRKAMIRVGSRTPFVSDVSTSGSFVNSSVKYEDLGLTLEVTPHINSATEVSLIVNVKDGAIDPAVPPLNGQAYTFTDRQIQTQLVVNDRHTVVLAGVISERERERVDQVPLLWRLPVVGDKLFTNREKSQEKVELLTFITPYILQSRYDSAQATKMVRDRSGSPKLRSVNLEAAGWKKEQPPTGMTRSSVDGNAWPEIPANGAQTYQPGAAVEPPSTGDPWKSR